MTRSNLLTCLAMALSVGLLITGCKPPPAATNDPPPADPHEHAHTGPHGGHIIELGKNHDFHAEVVEDHDTSVVSIYMLDGDMKEKKIAAESVSLTFATDDGKVQSFDLNAVSPADGKASQFDAPDSKLFDLMHEHHDIEGKLRVTTDDTQFVGTLDHHAH